ncbi:MAG: hypothetical protein RIS54_1729 [Verrucomicrobiota bacterium]
MPAAAQTKPVCRHCGAPLPDEAARTSGFCCAGCAYVYRLVHESGLEGYYRIKDDLTPPVDAAVFQTRDFDWLDELQREAEAVAGSDSPRTILGLQGISCAGCVWLIEKLFTQLPGARRINVNAQLGEMELSWTAGEFSLASFARRLHAFNYLVGPHDAESAEPESRGLVRRIGLTTAFALNVMLFTLPSYFGMEETFTYARLFGALSLVFGTLSVLAGGGYFLQRAWQGLRFGILHIDLPISLGIVGAYAGSLYGWIVGHEGYVYFDFVATFIVLMLTGRWAQVAAVERNRRRLLALQPRPQHLTVIQSDGTRQRLAPEHLAVGQTLELRSGQILPVEATLESGAAEFSLASINGEAAPRAFSAGQRVPAGSLLLSRIAVRLTARQAWSQSLLAELTARRSEDAARHPLLERIVQGYLIGILVIAASAGMAWGFGTGDLLHTGAVVTAILVVSCPCAIGLAFPLAEEMASVALRRRGVFVRNPSLWPRLQRVRKMLFDKTGTLTLETPVLENPAVLAGLDDTARQALFTLVQDNPHPVSQCLLENLLALGPAPKPLPGEVIEEVGSGVAIGDWSLGRPGWRSPAGAFGTVLAHGPRTIAVFALRDAVRQDAADELRALATMGFAAHILSGDDPTKVRALTRELGLPDEAGHGHLTPQAKADWLRDNTREDALMLGDGMNDSLAFDAAYCRGTPVVHRGVLEQKADFYYLGRGIGGIRALFAVNQVRRRTEWAILIFSVVYNVLAVGFAAAGHINPLVAAVLMPANSLFTLALVSFGMRRAFAPPETKIAPGPEPRGDKVVVGPGFEPGKA